jgi:hypothetical protein
MSQQAKWWPDPYGRFQQRYFDGSKWTEHVIDTNGTQTIDPLGTTVSVPFATPTSSATSTPAATRLAAAPVAANVNQFLDGLGPDARTRPAVHLSIALAGIGGAAAAFGIATAIIGDAGSSRPRIAIAAVVIVALAYAVRIMVTTQPELRSAAVGAAVVGIPGLAGAITGVGGGSGGTLVLAGVLLVAAWVLPIMRGRPILLGAGAVAMVLALTTIDNNPSSESDLFGFGVSDLIGGKSWLFVLVAMALLAVVWWLDAHDYHGVGTSLVVAAILATALAVLKVVENVGSTGAALLLAFAGLVVAVVGDHGQRRATTWFGVAVAAIGTIGVFTSAMEPSSTSGIATTLIISGIVLIVVPAVVKLIMVSRSAHAEP